VPILFYDMVGEKKKRITEALAERRAAAGTLTDEEPADEALEGAAEEMTDETMAE